MKIKAGLFTLIWMMSATLFAQNDDLLFSPKGVAEVHITLANGQSINVIKNEKWDNDYAGKIEGTMTILNSASSIYGSGDLYNGKILIDGRGNTTWHLPKKPYNIDLITNDGADNPASLLGMPADEEWSLISFWHDRSLMRIPLAMYLGQRMNGILWTPRMQYVEVWINNDYRGLYCLSEKIKRADDRIKLKKLDASSTDLSGGYILEASGDASKNKQIEIATQFKTSQDINFIFKYPKPKNVTTQQINWIKNHLNEFEQVLWSNDFKDPDKGYRKYINEESFIDWTILHELSNGTDNLFHASVFVHKDRGNKLNMSAPWDFDLSFGNVDNDAYYEDRIWIRGHRWFGRLYQDEQYARKFNDRYDALMPLLDKIPDVLEANYKQLENLGCIEREQAKWPQILTEYKDKEDRRAPTTYKSHAKWLGEWCESRKTWIYISLGLTEEERGERLKASRPTIRVMDPEALEKRMAFDTKVMRGYTYVWNDIQTSNATRRLSKDGKYWVQIKDSKNNISLPSNVLVIGNVTSIETPVDDSFYVYLNPVNSCMIINYKSDGANILSIRMTDIKGLSVKNEQHRINFGMNQIKMDISDLSSGIYIMKYGTNKTFATKKIIISK